MHTITPRSHHPFPYWRKPMLIALAIALAVAVLYLAATRPRPAPRSPPRRTRCFLESPRCMICTKAAASSGGSGPGRRAAPAASWPAIYSPIPPGRDSWY